MFPNNKKIKTPTFPFINKNFFYVKNFPFGPISKHNKFEDFYTNRFGCVKYSRQTISSQL